MEPLSLEGREMKGHEVELTIKRSYVTGQTEELYSIQCFIPIKDNESYFVGIIVEAVSAHLLGQVVSLINRGKISVLSDSNFQN